MPVRSPSQPPAAPAQRAGADIPRPLLFWTGLLMTATGVLLHLPDYLSMRDTGYRMAGMSMTSSPTMMTGMALIVVGVVLGICGLVQRRPVAAAASAVARFRVQAGDQSRLSSAHARLIAVISLGLVIDMMKPGALAFLLPGMRAEYHISVAQAATLPVSSLTGTVLGSLVWGYLGDRVGRRATFMLSSLLFIATTICAAMTTFNGNLLMCFFMGAAAGGLLPVAYAMMAESIPARQRSFVMVLQAGLATVIAYFCTSALATLLLPHFGWRIMWFTQFPFAVLILLVNRWLPESPRFLLLHGRVAEAKSVVARYGMQLVPVDETATAGPAAPAAEPAAKAARGGTFAALFGRGARLRTLVVGFYALSWGVINWGFMTFLPTLLKSGAHMGSSGNAVLFWSSLLAIPGTALVALFYARWSSRKAMALYGSLSALALGAMALIGLGSGQVITIGLLGLLITGTSGVVAMLSPYTAEVFPTAVRGAGSGFAAACGKVSGMFGPPLLAMVLVDFPGVRVIALICAVPMVLATVAVLLRGQETAGRNLEELQSEASEREPALVGSTPRG